MKTKKLVKIVALLLAVGMLMAFLPLVSAAQEAEQPSAPVEENDAPPSLSLVRLPKEESEEERITTAEDIIEHAQLIEEVSNEPAPADAGIFFGLSQVGRRLGVPGSRPASARRPYLLLHPQAQASSKIIAERTQNP